MTKRVTSNGGGQFKLVANFISAVALQYWLIARKLFLEYTGCNVGHPKWIFQFNRAAWNYSTRDYSLVKGT